MLLESESDDDQGDKDELSDCLKRSPTAKTTTFRMRLTPVGQTLLHLHRGVYVGLRLMPLLMLQVGAQLFLLRLTHRHLMIRQQLLLLRLTPPTYLKK